jgi:hypothetical protein
MKEKLMTFLKEIGFYFYPNSLRKLGDEIYIFVAKKDFEKMIGILKKGNFRLSLPYFSEDKYIEEIDYFLNLYPLSFENFLILKENFGISPTTCNNKTSFGTGDRLGLVTPAHISSLGKYSVFPILAQQSPRELIKTNRNFKDVLLKVIMGVLEVGYHGKFGADADHIKDENYLMEGISAGFTLYTLDVSDLLLDISKIPVSEQRERFRKLSSFSKRIIEDFSGKKFYISSTEYFEISEEELCKSALIYEKAMSFIEMIYEILKNKNIEFDLEISIDEGDKETTVEDHLFVAEYLHRKGIEFWSIAPRFPGEFQKAIDYKGDINRFSEELKKHYLLSNKLEGYKLSLHSGSDKFSIYKVFSEITQGNFHIKTSGTSWLQGIRLIAEKDKELFYELYKIALENLEESKKAYKVSIRKEDLPSDFNPEESITIFEKPEVKQLFHISYGVLLEEKKKRIYEVLNKYEEEHYKLVSENIDKHLKEIFS